MVDIASATDAEPVDISRFQLAVPKAALRGGAQVRRRLFGAEFMEYDCQSGMTNFRLDNGTYPQVLIPQELRPYVRTMTIGGRVYSLEQVNAVSVKPET